MKLSHKLTVTTTIAAMVVAPLIGLFVFYSARNTLEKSISINQSEIAKNMMADIDRHLYLAYRDARMMAEDKFLEDFLEEKTSGKSLYKDTQLSEVLFDEIEEKLLLTGPWDLLMLLGSNGKVVFSSDKSSTLKDIGEFSGSRTAYEKALTGEAYYSDLILSDVTGRPTVIFAVPIRSEITGKIGGVLEGHYGWPMVLQELDNANPLSQVYLFNKTGAIIASRPRGQRMRQYSLSGIDLVKKAISGQRVVSGIIVLDKETGPLLATCKSQDGLFGYKGSGWGLFMGTPLDKAFAPVNRLAINIGLLVIIIMASMAGILYVVGKKITKPIVHLTGIVQAIEAGNFDVAAEVVSTDEVSILARAFNTMAETLRKTTVSRDYVDNILKNMIDTLLVVTPDGIIETVNQATLTLLGYEEKELIGKPAAIIFAEEEGVLFKGSGITDLIKNRSIINVEKTYLAKDRRKIPILLSGSLMRDKEGKIRGAVCVAIDITERKRAEEKLRNSIQRLHATQAATLNMMEDAEDARKEAERTMAALRESEQRFKSLVSNLPGSIYRCANDPDWTMEFISDAVEEISGYPASDFIRNRVRSFASVIHPDDREPVDKAVQEGVRKKMPYIIEYRIIRANGEIRWVYEKGQGIFDSKGSFLCLDGAIFDVTERKKTQQAISSLNETFLNLGPDFGKNIQLITQTCGELLGAACALYNRLETGMLCSAGTWNVPKGYHPMDKPEGHICYDLIRKGKQGGAYIVRDLPRTDYYKSDPNVAAYGLKTYIGHAVEGKGRTVGALCAVFQEDVKLGENETMILGVLARALDNEEERRSAQEELESAYKDLESTQNASLNIMADLDRERKALDKSLQEKEALIREVHHRVKNNMQVISSLLKLQSNHIDDPSLKEIFKDSENRISSMAKVHERLYRTEDLAHIDFGDYINSLAIDIYHSFGAKASNIRLRVNVEDVALPIDTAIPCGLIVNELITNAIKYAFPGDRKGDLVIEMKKTGQLTIENRQLKIENEHSEIVNPQSSIELLVRDNGVGIPEDMDWKNAKSLGLNLVVSLTKQIRGEIELSREGGTEWRIRFEEGN